MLATSRNLGMLLGVALAGMVFSGLYDMFSEGLNLKEYTSEQMSFFLRSFRLTLLIASVIGVAGMALSITRSE